MLTRRHIRIKVMQALFSFYQGDQKNSNVALKALDESIQNIYNLYLYELKIFWHFHAFLRERLEIEKIKKIPNRTRQSRIDSLLNMPFMHALVSDKEVLKAWDKNRIDWDDDVDMIRGAFFSFWSKEANSDWFLSESILNDQEGVTWFKKFYSDAIANNLSIQSYYEDLNIHWSDDIDAAQMMAVQTLQNAKTGKPLLVNLFKDKKDKIFAQMLFTKCLDSHLILMERVRSKSEKWDYERLAPLDRCIIEQSLVEVMNAQEVPVKVTINEAIELAKQYSTEKSPGFINGLLDSLISDIIKEGKVKKVGRGLID
mgnify:CR=1 FL=1